jgi:hypothetical protein
MVIASLIVLSLFAILIIVVTGQTSTVRSKRSINKLLDSLFSSIISDSIYITAHGNILDIIDKKLSYSINNNNQIRIVYGVYSNNDYFKYDKLNKLYAGSDYIQINYIKLNKNKFKVNYDTIFYNNKVLFINYSNNNIQYIKIINSKNISENIINSIFFYNKKDLNK